MNQEERVFNLFKLAVSLVQDFANDPPTQNEVLTKGTYKGRPIKPLIGILISHSPRFFQHYREVETSPTYIQEFLTRCSSSITEINNLRREIEYMEKRTETKQKIQQFYQPEPEDFIDTRLRLERRKFVNNLKAQLYAKYDADTTAREKEEIEAAKQEIEKGLEEARRKDEQKIQEAEIAQQQAIQVEQEEVITKPKGLLTDQETTDQQTLPSAETTPTEHTFLPATTKALENEPTPRPLSPWQRRGIETIKAYDKVNKTQQKNDDTFEQVEDYYIQKAQRELLNKYVYPNINKAVNRVVTRGAQFGVRAGRIGVQGTGRLFTYGTQLGARASTIGARSAVMTGGRVIHAATLAGRAVITSGVLLDPFVIAGIILIILILIIFSFFYNSFAPYNPTPLPEEENAIVIGAPPPQGAVPLDPYSGDVCPIPNGTITCSDFWGSNASCRHCYPGSYPNESMIYCVYPGTFYAIDIAGEDFQTVYLPTVGGHVVEWTYLGEERSLFTGEAIQKYAGRDQEDGNQYYLQLHHTQPGSGALGTNLSGTPGARICGGGCNERHVHVQIGSGSPSVTGTTWLPASKWLCN